MNSILNLLNENPRLTDKQIAVMLGKDEAEVSAAIAQFERDGIIGGYRAIIDWDRADSGAHRVTALVELRVTPRPDTGFDQIADELLDFEEVDSVHLMSGGYDFAVYVSGNTLQDIAQFVARRLSTLDSVVTTTTHFMLKRYKEHGVVLTGKRPDERRNTLL